MSPLRSTRRGKQILVGTLLASAVAIAGLTAQGYGVFEPGFEGEIWELRATLPLPAVTNEFGDPVPFANWASGIAWVDGELFEVDNYTGVVNKFAADLTFVDTLSACPGPAPPAGTCADWNGLPGTPSAGWAPNEAI